ncbi:MAG: ferrous iron transport protein B [Methanobacteriota archaeon]|nr:MAG: ferrous iron transport protein B [Euryarchaeota archaeon]
MHGHGGGSQKDGVKTEGKIALIGSPNVGKSVIFHRLTGRYATVSNYPGTTVELSRGVASLGGKDYEIIDTPGTYSLFPLSEDERVTQRIILKERPDVLVHVVDGKNISLMLPLTLELIETGLPVILVVNMLDEAGERGIELDLAALQRALGIPVVGTIATERKGIDELKKSIAHLASFDYRPIRTSYPPRIESALKEVMELLPDGSGLSRRFIALLALAGDREAVEALEKGPSKEAILKRAEEMRREYRHSMRYIAKMTGKKRSQEILRRVVRRREGRKNRVTDRLGELTVRPLTGFPILLVVFYVMYRFVGVFGAGTLVDFFEQVLFGRYLNPAVSRLVESHIPFPLLQELLVGEYGLITMGLTYSIAIVLPIVSTFFFAFGILEDSGYFPRLTIMANRAFKKIGLSGKSALPMILGLGCDTMATLTTRILDSRKERIIATLLLALAVPCSAQLGVILGIVAGVSTRLLIVVFGVVFLQIFIVGYLASKVIPGESSDFIVEIPPIRIPHLSNVLVKTYMRMEWFLFEAVPLFLLGTLILFVLDKLSMLALVEGMAQPVVVGLLGLPKEATAAFIMGFLRRDYGAAGIFAMSRQGLLDPIQLAVSLVVIMLFVPCIANLFVIIKERGKKTALYIVAFIFPYAIFIGAVLNYLLRAFEVSL